MQFDDINEESLKVLSNLAEPNLTIAVDTEATGLNVASGEDKCIGVSIAAVVNGTAYSHYFPFHHPTGDNCGSEVLAQLKQTLEGDNTLLFVNAQFDILSLETIGIYTEHTDIIDVSAMAHLINENKPYNKGLDSLAQYYLKEPGKVKDPEIDKEKKKTGWQNTTWQQTWDYAVLDAVSTWRIYSVLRTTQQWAAVKDIVCGLTSKT